MFFVLSVCFQLLFPVFVRGLHWLFPSACRFCFCLVFFCLNSTLTIVYDYVKVLFSKMGKVLCDRCNPFLSMDFGKAERRDN
jgi:hypothetical protein